MSVQSEIDRITNNVQTTLNTIADTGVEVGTGSDALPAAAAALANEKAPVNHEHSYNDLTDKPTIPTALSQLSGDTTHRTVTDAEKSTWNAKSDFSGSYNDLTDKPTIPSAYSHPASHPASMITGLATVATSGSYNDLSDQPTIPAAYSHPSTHPASMISAGTFAGQVVANASGQAAASYVLRNSKIASAEEAPSVNGQICWKYE